jgi:hypothetical protein
MNPPVAGGSISNDASILAASPRRFSASAGYMLLWKLLDHASQLSDIEDKPTP